MTYYVISKRTTFSLEYSRYTDELAMEEFRGFGSAKRRCEELRESGCPDAFVARKEPLEGG